MPETSALNIPHSPIAALGTITLLIAYVVAAYAAAAGIIGNAQHRRRLVTSSIYALYGFFALMMLASALIIYGFVTHDYTIKYVTHYSDTTMPLYYKITAYWGGLDGSMMFWVSVLSVFAAIAVRANSQRHRDMIGYVVGTIMVVQIFFLSILIYNKNPFATWLTTPPVDGKGLNPLLQTYWMTIHPPSLYIGFVAATIPFAFGIAAMASGRLDDMWLGSVRSWTLICWFFLSFGLILGGRWAYEELGWGGYWAWDPVENAGLLPWFTTTAFLHSVMIQEQRGMMKGWNLILVITSFFLTIFGTFMTRSGVVQSVHAFGEDNQLALLFILFMFALLVISFGLLAFRMPQLRSSNTFESLLSREYAFLLNNWILLGCAVFVLFATMFPTLSEAVTGERITVGPPFFNKWMIPLALTLLFLAGAAPLLAWRRTTRERLWGQFIVPTAAGVGVMVLVAIFIPESRVLSPILSDAVKLPITLVNTCIVFFTLGSIAQEFARGMMVRRRQTGSGPVTSVIGLLVSKQRKYGGYIIHAAIAVMFFGFAGKSCEAMQDFSVSTKGETFSIRGYEFAYEDLQIVDSDWAKRAIARVTLKRDGKVIDNLVPERRQYKKQPDEPTTEVSMHNEMREDVYLILTGYESERQVVNFRVYINPLINWVWLGFFILALGTGICLLPKVGGPAPPSAGARGKVTGAVAVLILALATGGVARAQGEHKETVGHDVGASEAHLYRPNDAGFLAPYRARAVAAIKQRRPDLAPGSAEHEDLVAAELRPIVALAEKLMRDLVCLCGGCSRESILECKCPLAADERGEILQQLSQHEDLSSEAARDAAYDAVTAHFVAKYEARRKGDGLRVLMTPPNEGFNTLSWIVPYVALAGALALLYGVGRRWVRRGSVAVAQGAGAASPQEQKYADLLDDELRDTDD